jgi:hypothetical protein
MTTFTENATIAKEINQCLTNHTLTYSPTFDYNDFRTTDNIITNHLATSKLSDIILMNYFPQNPITEYHHFTDIGAFQNIIKEKELWLFSVKKRFTEDEFKPFYDVHKMDGYKLRQNSAGVAMESDLVENAFYTSFTNDNLSKDAEAYMWKYFAKETGVRLVFEVSNLNTHLRQVYYPSSATQKDLPLLTELINVASKRNKYLIIAGIATIGFFYLPHPYNIERESRLLVKRETGKYFSLEFGTKNGFEYLRFPFNRTNPLAEFKLKKVIFDTNTDITEAEKIIKSNADFKKIQIEKNNR